MFTLPNLNYAKNALDPIMSVETLDLHHSKHHQTYITNLNNLIKGTSFEKASLEDIVKQTANDPSKAGIFNNAGQHYNHILFWKCMRPSGGGKMPEKLEKKIIKTFGTVEKFKEDFIQAGVTQFGSGWAWLSLKGDELVISKTANGSNPLVDNLKPIFGCDVWEHAYYVDYRNRRPDYLKAFVEKLANWEFVESQLN
ncbi:MAG: superoxide dismutase [Pelagibacterales bacterium]|nr:superoxide dismutase [Pelagibacterales bacterium]